MIHPSTKQILGRMIGNFPHALLLSGPSGVGVCTIARSLAKQLRAVTFVIEPKRRLDGGKNLVIDHEKGSIIIDDIRELYQMTRTKNTQKIVYIFDFGERTMTPQAQNAFLKLLEEPRDNVHFILATHRPDTLLPTILSRSQRIDVRKITSEQTARLLESMNIDDAVKKARITYAAKGLPAQITRLATNNKLYESRVTYMQDAKTMLGNSNYDKLVIIHKYKDSRTGAVMLIDDMNTQLKTVLAKSGDPHLVQSIAKHLVIRDRIIANGNIRLQLADVVV